MPTTGSLTVAAAIIIGIAAVAGPVEALPPAPLEGELPTVQKEFDPPGIPKGATSTIEFLIVNQADELLTDVAFTDDFPAGMTVAAPANALSSCGGTVTASPGSASMSFSGGSVDRFGFCVINTDVTSSTAGTHTNTTSQFSSSAGTSLPASGDLKVFEDQPGFTKEFGPDTVLVGDVSSLTFTITNREEDIPVGGLTFTDNLPAGMLLATPANAVNGCSGSLVAPDGGDKIALSNGSTGAGSTCTITVDIEAVAIGSHLNRTSSLTSVFGDSPFASDTLDVVDGPAGLTADLSITKTDSPDPVAPGSSLDYSVEVINAGPDQAVGVIVADSLPAGVTFVSTSGCAEDPSGIPTCSLGDIAPGASASFTVTVTVDQGIEGVIVNNATVATESTDPNPDNDSTDEDTTVEATTTSTTTTTTTTVAPTTTSSSTTTTTTTVTSTATGSSATTTPATSTTAQTTSTTTGQRLSVTGGEGQNLAIIGTISLLLGSVLILRTRRTG